jgi:hypothetical protein
MIGWNQNEVNMLWHYHVTNDIDPVLIPPAVKLLNKYPLG